MKNAHNLYKDCKRIAAAETSTTTTGTLASFASISCIVAISTLCYIANLKINYIITKKKSESEWHNHDLETLDCDSENVEIEPAESELDCFDNKHSIAIPQTSLTSSTSTQTEHLITSTKRKTGYYFPKKVFTSKHQGKQYLKFELQAIATQLQLTYENSMTVDELYNQILEANLFSEKK